MMLGVQDTVQWMEEKEIVQRMLRANLHQRQYVEQVGQGSTSSVEGHASKVCCQFLARCL
jgi:hypothetical protein